MWCRALPGPTEFKGHMYQSHDSIYHSASSALFAKLISKFSFDNTFLPVVFILGSICLLAFKKKKEVNIF